MIAWDSIPQYDQWGWWGDYWSCAQWQEWYFTLKNHYSLEETKTIWLNAYHKAGFGAASYDCRTFNSDFKNFLLLEGIYDQAHSWATQPISAGVTIFSEGGKLLQKTGEGLGVSSKIIKFIIPAAIIYSIYRLTKKL